MYGVIGFFLVVGFIVLIVAAIAGWEIVVALAIGLPLAILVGFWIDKIRMRNLEYRRRIEWEKRKKRQTELKRKQERNEQLIARFGKLITYEEYKAGTACIWLSPYCKGRKSRRAIVCKNCYLAQGFDRPLGFAQSGGGATKDELGQMVVARLGYHRIGPGQWRRD